MIGQVPCSPKDSLDPPLPQDVRFPSPKDQCPPIALTAAKKAQATTLQRWVSNTLIYLKGSLKSKRKATVQSSSTAPCPSTQQPDCSSDLIHDTGNHLQCLLNLLESTQHFTVAQHTNVLGCIQDNSFFLHRGCEVFRCINSPRISLNSPFFFR